MPYSFAQEKIQKIINCIKPVPVKDKTNSNFKYPNEDVVKNNIKSEFEIEYTIEELRKMVSMIGEQIVREKLHDMLDSCLIQGETNHAEIKRKKEKLSRLQVEINCYN